MVTAALKKNWIRIKKYYLSCQDLAFHQYEETKKETDVALVQGRKTIYKLKKIKFWNTANWGFPLTRCTVLSIDGCQSQTRYSSIRCCSEREFHLFDYLCKSPSICLRPLIYQHTLAIFLHCSYDNLFMYTIRYFSKWQLTYQRRYSLKVMVDKLPIILRQISYWQLFFAL